MDTTVVFRGVDAGLSPMLEKLRQAQRETAQSMVKDSMAYNTTIKEASRTIDEQIKQQERLIRIKKQASLTEAQAEKSRREHALKEIDSPEFAQRLRAAGPEEKERLLSQVKKTEEEYSTRQNKYREDTTKAHQQFRQDKLQIDLLKDILEAIRQTAREEIKESKASVAENIRMWKEGAEPLNAEAEMKLQTQEQMLQEEDNDDDKDKLTAWKIAKGAFWGGLAKDTVVGMGSRGWRALKNMSGAESGEQAIPSLWGIMPGVGDVLQSGAQKHVQELEQQNKATNLVRARINNAQKESAIKYGYDVSEFMSIAEQFILARGGGGKGGWEKNTTDMIELMKAYGISQGVLMQSAGYGRYDVSGNEIMGNAVSLIQAMVKQGALAGGDNTRVEELLKEQNSLTEEQSSILETVDQSVNSGVLAAFEKVGGSFSNDPRAAQRIIALNQALVTPANDYQKATAFSVLSQQNPGADLFELMEMQQKGLTAPGYMSGTMKQLKQRYGGGNRFLMSVMNRFGLSASQARTLGESYMLNPTEFDKLGEAELAKLISGEDTVKGLAEGHTTTIEKEQATLSDSYAISMWKGLSTTMAQVSAHFEESSGILSATAKTLFSELSKLIASAESKNW